MYWKPWEMVTDTSIQFEFPRQSLSSRFLWPSKSRVCGELSKRQGQGYVAKLIGVNSVSGVCVYIHACVRARVTYFLPCLLEWMPRLLLFSCLEERGLYSRVATIRGTRTYIVRMRRTWRAKANGRSVLFDSIVREHHV